jgi:microcystin-dependent protein
MECRKKIFIFLIFIVLLLIFFNINFLKKIKQNIENFDSQNFSLESLQNIVKVYGDISGVATFNNINVTGDISGNLTSLKGIICAWSGSINTIPRGWALCDGSGDTPDLRGRFILGHNTNTGYNGDVDSSGNTIIRNSNDVSGAKVGNNLAGVIGNVGGEIMHILTNNEMPSHTHTSWAEACDGGNCPLNGGGFRWTGDYHVNRETTATGGGKAHSILPPFYVLAFIIKL